MKKLLVCFLVAVMTISSLSVLPAFGDVLGYQELGYTPGETEHLVDANDCIATNGATVSDSGVKIEKDGSATWGFFLPYASRSVKIVHTGAGKITFKTERNTYELELSDTGSTVLEFGKNLGYEQQYRDYIGANMYGNMQDYVEHEGEKEVTITASSEITVQSLSFEKELTPTPNSGIVPNVSDYALETTSTTFIHEDANIIIVNGARRYLDNNDTTQRPIYLDDMLYIPMDTLAKALGYYCEDIPEKGYALMRSTSHEVVMINGEITVSQGTAPREAAPANVIRYFGGRTYASVRYFGELTGETVAYKNGLIAIDDKYTVRDIMNDDEFYSFANSKFSDFRVASVVGYTYHVSQKSGDDNYDGTALRPFKTIAKAAEVATAGDTVIIHSGTYRETLSPKNNGTPTAPITFKAAEGEEVVLSALKDLGKPVKISNEGFNTDKDIYVLNMSNDLGLGRNQIFVNGEVQVEARYPNGPGYLADNRLSKMWGVEGDIYKKAGDKTTMASDTLLNQPDDYWKGGIWVGQFGRAYALTSGVIESSTQGSLTIGDTRPGKWWWDAWTTTSAYKESGTGNYFNYGYIMGHKNALDIEGEWVKDTDDGRLYIILPEDADPDTVVVEAKTRQLVANLTNKKFINIEGIETIGGSVTMNGSEMCMLNGLDMKYITHFTLSADQKNGFIDAFPYTDTAIKDKNGAPFRGEVGIFVSGTDNIITNTHIDHSAGAGLYLNGLYSYIDNNLMNDCGYGGAYVAGIHIDVLINEARDKARGGHGIYYNTIYNTGRACIDWNVNEHSSSKTDSVHLPADIAYNDFHDANITATDSGTTYGCGATLGVDKQATQMHHNYVYSTFTAEDKHPFLAGIYWDNHMHAIDTYDNIVFTTGSGAPFSAHHIFQQYTVGYEAFVKIWDNQKLGYLEGGVDALEAHYFSEERPFFAGSSIGNDTEYTKNYDRFSAGKYGMSATATYAELSEGVVVEDDGYATFTEDGQYIVFKDVDFGENANEILISYKGDSNWTQDEVEIRIDSATTDSVYYMTAACDARSVEEAHTHREVIAQTSGKHDVYVKVVDYKSIRIGGVAAYTKINDGDTADFTNYTYASAYNDYVKDTPGTGGIFMQLQNENDGYNPAASIADQTWEGYTLRYADQVIEEDSKYFAIAAGSRGNYRKQLIRIYLVDTAVPRITSDISQNANAEYVGEVSVINKAFHDVTPIITELPETVKAGKYDIYLQLVADGNPQQTSNLNYFGFLKEGTDISNYRTNLRQWGGLFDKTLSVQNADKPFYKLWGPEWENYHRILFTLPGTSAAFTDVDVIKSSTKLEVCYSADANYDGQPVEVRLGSIDGELIASFTTEASTDGKYTQTTVDTTRELEPGSYTVYVNFGGSGEQTCQFAWFEFKADGDGTTGTTPATEPYFELGFSETNGVLNLTDKQNSGATLTASSANATNFPDDKPVYKTDATNGVKYLQFSSDSNGSRVNSNSRVAVTFPDTRIVSGSTKTENDDFTADDVAEGLTIETWAKADATTIDLNFMFAYSLASRSQNDFEFRVQDAIFQTIAAQRLTGANRKSLIAATNYFGKWAHYVYTRTYDSTAKKFTTKLYINGELKGTVEDTVSTTDKYDKNHKLLTIGAGGKEKGNESGGRSFIGGIAEFKVYTSALSATQVKAAYDASVDTYY